MNSVETARELLRRYRQVPDVGTAASRPGGRDEAALVEAAWRRGRSYSPVFSYPEVDPASSSRLLALADDAVSASERFPSDWSFALFADFLHQQAAWNRAVCSHDAEAITRVSFERHGALSEADVSAARQELVGIPSAPSALPEPVALDSVTVVLEEALALAGAENWRVVVEPMVARMAVSAQRQVLRLSASAAFSPGDVVRLAVHEVGCHVARSVAGARQPRPLLALGLGPHHLATEEGLAVWLEGRLGALLPSDRRRYALRVLAVHAAVSGSFADAYAEVRPFCSAAEAFTLVLRVKRGLRDTSEPGAYVKDHVYFTGSRRVAEFVAASPGALAVLSCGKVSVDAAALAAQDIASGALTPGLNILDLAAQLRDLAAARVSAPGEV